MDDLLIELMAIGTQPLFAIRMPDGSLMRVADTHMPLSFEANRLVRPKPAADTDTDSA